MRTEAIRGMFGLLTASFEDLASLSAEGQGNSTERHRLATQLASELERTEILANAIVLLAPEPD